MFRWIDRLFGIPSDEQMLSMTEMQRYEWFDREFKLIRNVSIAATVIGAAALVSSVAQLLR